MIRIELVEKCYGFIKCVSPDAWITLFGTVFGTLVSAGIAALVAYSVSKRTIKAAHLVEIDGFRYFFEEKKTTFNKMEAYYELIESSTGSDNDKEKEKEARDVSVIAKSILADLDKLEVPTRYLDDVFLLKSALLSLSLLHEDERYLMKKDDDYSYLGPYKIAKPSDNYHLYKTKKEQIMKKIEV
ncbi:hypothetical protein [Sporosarcina sp. P1]|uniref:hypothetical protein n=1 Tax=Sporosarcina sp. P1 TaxID=2048257 RepID=UPI000C170344|nr:hypothetical protein [Sporosarcina sp. P1]PIC82090.1 hypothetical protein CSV73_14280 [Sporosarcina sp. P1]